MKSVIAFDVVISQSKLILKLFPCKDQSLLVYRYSLLVLDPRFQDFNSIFSPDLNSHRLSSQSLYIHYDFSVCGSLFLGCLSSLLNRIDNGIES